jgi:3-hydroxybutyryl-CoA dehydrogenase
VSDNLIPTRVAVLGAGTMGAGIAVSFALSGSKVVNWSRQQSSLERAAGQIDDALSNLGDLGLIAESAAVVRERISLSTDIGSTCEGVDLVVETIREDVDDKRQLLRHVVSAVGPATILASNTSSLPLEDIFKEVPSKKLVAGLHWFNPPELVDLVEVVRVPSTSEETVAQLTGWMTALGKTPIVVNQAVPGFIANRLQYALIREAYHLVSIGVCTPADVDRAVTSALGPRWAAVGPFQSMDLAGLDVHAAVTESLFPALSTESAVPEILRRLTASGALGCKTGQGILGTYDPEHIKGLKRSRAAVWAALKSIGKQQ